MSLMTCHVWAVMFAVTHPRTAQRKGLLCTTHESTLAITTAVMTDIYRACCTAAPYNLSANDCAVLELTTLDG
eukprot:19686-Heterococcus_DN1.PRE.3